MTWALPPRYRIGDRYEVVKVLGQGSFGITYKARGADGGLVAIKEYFPQDVVERQQDGSIMLIDPSKREMFDWGYEKFEEERRALNGIRHPNIVTLTDSIVSNATRYLVFEFIDGQTLQQRIRTQARMWPDDLRSFLLPILDGVEEVHRNGWVHKDIKPDNLMVEDGTGRPVLIDFGLARRPGEGRLETMPAGGFNYMAKEQLSEDVTKLGPWTDIFGLGGICYFALFGRPPQSSTLRLAEGGYEPASVLGADLNEPGMMHAIDCALEMEPKDRFQSIVSFREAILQNGAPVMVHPVDRKISPEQTFRPKAAVVERKLDDPATTYSPAAQTPIEPKEESSGPPLLLWIGAAAVAVGAVTAAALLMPRAPTAAPAQKEAAFEVAADPAEESKWVETREADTVAAYEAFLAAYPGSVHAAEAAWKSTPETRERVQAFLEAYPQSRQAAEARRVLESIGLTEQRMEQAAWEAALEIDAPGAYQKYLEQHPDGAHAEEARAKLQ